MEEERKITGFKGLDDTMEMLAKDLNKSIEPLTGAILTHAFFWARQLPENANKSDNLLKGDIIKLFQSLRDSAFSWNSEEK